MERLKFNELVLNSALDRYESAMEAIREGELYKWSALASFSGHWDLSAQNMPEMLRSSLSEFADCLTSSLAYCFASLESLAKSKPEIVRFSLESLLNEERPLADRVNAFHNTLGRQAEKCRKRAKASGGGQMEIIRQTLPAISAYLFLSNPGRHYIYKEEELSFFLSMIDLPYHTKSGNDNLGQAYCEYERFCDELLAYIRSNRPGMIERSRSMVPEEFASLDPNDHLIVNELITSASTYLVVPHWKHSLRKIVDKLHRVYFKDLGLETPKKVTQQLYSLTSSVSSLLPEHCDPLLFLSTMCGSSLPAEERKSLFLLTIRHLHVSANVPMSFAGLPDINLSDLRGDQSSDASDFRLKLFMSAYKLSRQPSESSRKEFVRSFDAAQANGRFSFRTLSSALFLVDPDCFPPLNHATCRYLEGKYGVRPPEAGTGQGYLDFIGFLKKLINGPFSSLALSARMGEERSSRAVVASLSSRGCETGKYPLTKRYSEGDFLKEVYLDESELETLLILLKTKKNLILQGPPGTGKTFAARRLAYVLLGCTDHSRVQMVQFHQGTTYDDFVYGYRPTADGAFEPRPGVFAEFCERASVERNTALREGRDAPAFVFIIDEINRANVSKVFGELLMCIEAEHRGEAVLNPVSRGAFSVPDNVFIIGMMNTADRGLALIDYALRRRFCFFEMRPALANGRFRASLSDSPELLKLVDAVARLNTEIESDPSLGRGFVFGHSYFCGKGEVRSGERASGIVDYELAPLIEEYWFDNPSRAAEAVSRLRGAIK